MHAPLTPCLPPSLPRAPFQTPAFVRVRTPSLAAGACCSRLLLAPPSLQLARVGSAVTLSLRRRSRNASTLAPGWGWGLASYTRNIQILNNSISYPMQLLADGGGVYTNTPCYGCHVSRNYFTWDPHVYGCLYHDGGSSLWTDENNVFNHMASIAGHPSQFAVFCHGECPGITISPVFYNDSKPPFFEGGTNNALHNADGVCGAPVLVKLQPGQQWPPVAAEVVANAGRRSPPPEALPPALSPPVNKTQSSIAMQQCARFAALPCNSNQDSQRWILTSGPTPGGGGNITSVRSAVKRNASCWEANDGGYGASITCNKVDNNNYGGGDSVDGCKPLPNGTENVKESWDLG